MPPKSLKWESKPARNILNFRLGLTLYFGRWWRLHILAWKIIIPTEADFVMAGPAYTDVGVAEVPRGSLLLKKKMIPSQKLIIIHLESPDAASTHPSLLAASV